MNHHIQIVDIGLSRSIVVANCNSLHLLATEFRLTKLFILLSVSSRPISSIHCCMVSIASSERFWCLPDVVYWKQMKTTLAANSTSVTSSGSTNNHTLFSITMIRIQSTVKHLRWPCMPQGNTLYWIWSFYDWYISNYAVPNAVPSDWTEGIRMSSVKVTQYF